MTLDAQAWRRPAKTNRSDKPRGRQRNVDRTSATRKRLLEATIICLRRSGYGAVTNVAVAAEAGVSRGAMIYHFPLRQNLLAATITYAHSKLRLLEVVALASLESGLPRFRALIDLAWTLAQTPEGRALNEIRNGSPSEPKINAALMPIMNRAADDHARFIVQQALEAGLAPDAEVHGLALATEMLVRSLADSTGPHQRERTTERALLTLKIARENIIARQLGPDAALDRECLGYWHDAPGEPRS